MFHLASVALAANTPDPTEDFDVRVVLFRSPNQLRPDDPCFSEVAATIGPWSDQVWIELGGQLEPDFPAQPPPAGEAFSAQTFRSAIEPLVNRDKEFRLFP